MGKVAAYAKLLRIPGLGGLAIPPVIGAITVGVFDLYHLFLLFVIGALSAIYGFVLNDYVDVELDRLVKELQGKPLVSGEISRKNALMISLLCMVFAFLFIFLLFKGRAVDDLRFAAVLCIVLAAVLGSFYNVYGKKVVGSDFFVAASMGFVFLFGALSFGKPNIITWIVFLLTFNNLLHMNAVEGGIKDVDHDHIMGVRNIALLSGVRVEGKKLFIPTGFKMFGMSIRLFSVFLVFTPFVFFGYSYSVWQLLILGLAASGVLFFSIKLLSLKTFDRNIIRRFIATQSFLRYSLVPIMLISMIGVMYSTALILFPMIWYLVFTPLVGEKLFRPRM
ncbi:MAG: UbiA family prenyltransferase [Thermoplasmata archaeon]|nr:UbiA family prenyltransferase [Thermoplasmata archaeon]RLF27739.1 MAG: hypothetical protein DRN01_01655 [Thermoplasmata archaeon]